VIKRYILKKWKTVTGEQIVQALQERKRANAKFK